MDFPTYRTTKSILEYIEANKRIQLCLFCPALRFIAESSPLHIETLMICARFIKINNQQYRDKDSHRAFMAVDKALEMMFKNQKAVIFVENVILDVMKSQRFGKVRLNVKISPTNFYCEENFKDDVIFGENADLFCTRNLKKLKIHTFERRKDFVEHPILPKLSHLEIDRKSGSFPFTIADFSALPIPHLTICEPLASRAATTLSFWISEKIKKRKFSISGISHPYDVLYRIARSNYMADGIFEWRSCWIIKYDDDVGIECVITLDEDVTSIFHARFTINLQVLPKGSAMVGHHWRHPNWVADGRP